MAVAASAIIVLILSFFSSYLVTLYSLAVYIDPEDVESLLSGTSERRRKMLKRLASDPRAFVQIANIYKSLTLICITVASLELIHMIPISESIGRSAITFAGLVVVWLLFITVADLLPRRTTRSAVNDSMIRYLGFISFLYLVLFPIIFVYRKMLAQAQIEEPVSEEEKEEIVERAIETLAEQAGIGEAIVEEDEKEMIGHIFLLDQTIVKEIMSPRPEIIGIEKATTFSDIQRIVRDDGHSRFPVYDEKIDRIAGILYVKDLFNNMPKPGEEFVITKYLRKPFFVPESKIIGDLLREFRARQFHIAIVIDEYGGVSGLVTLEDILEEIVGEIQDEHDSEDIEFTKLSEYLYEVDANLMLEELQRNIDTDFDQGDYETVGGLIYDLVGSVPDEGVRVNWHTVEFQVLSIEGQRIKRVKVALSPSKSEDSE